LSRAKPVKNSWKTMPGIAMGQSSSIICLKNEISSENFDTLVDLRKASESTQVWCLWWLREAVTHGVLEWRPMSGNDRGKLGVLELFYLAPEWNLTLYLQNVHFHS
jgi:hypothetical protein